MTERDNRSRRQYSKEFKVDAVEVMMRSNKSIIDTATSSGIRADLLRRRKMNIQQTRQHHFPAAGI